MIRQYRNVIATVNRDIIRSQHPLFMDETNFNDGIGRGDDAPEEVENVSE